LATKSVSLFNSTSGGEPGTDYAFGGDAARGLARLGAALDAQQLFRLLQVALALGERLLAFHHAEARQLSQLLDQPRTNLCHCETLLTG
jgi:hypothetical protein